MFKPQIWIAALLVAILGISTSSCTKKSSQGENVINAALRANLKGLDPVYASDTYSNAVVSQIYETLLHYHYLKRPLELAPLVAETLPETSKDGLTHTFKLRKGVMFHDDAAFPGGKGREVTAQDFI
ncbi:MAG: hypothetical protein IT288_11600 [Bdellovibrionales bacterium]|nr:hypothetical protein [Bdellovibrionales bacterium]